MRPEARRYYERYDVVRVLDDPFYGGGPVGHVEETAGAMVKVRLDEGGHCWFKASELDKVDVKTWEKATKDAA